MSEAVVVVVVSQFMFSLIGLTTTPVRGNEGSAVGGFLLSPESNDFGRKIRSTTFSLKKNEVGEFTIRINEDG